MQAQLTLFATEKRCCRCKLVKPLDEFHRCAREPDGLVYHCKACERLRVRDYSKSEKKRDPVAKRAKDRRWRERNLEATRAAQRARYAANPEPTRERSRQWRIDNPDRARELARRDKARRALGRRGTPEGVAYVKAVQCDPCAYCGGPARELDHIVPVAGGGEPGYLNLTSACRSCNANKNDSSLLDFLLRRLP